MGKSEVFVTFSRKGGVGKTAVALGLACAFSKRNKKVLYLDLKRELHTADLYLGLQDACFFNFSDYLNGTEAEKVLFRNENQCPNLYLCNPPDKGVVIKDAKEPLERLLSDFHFDILILDPDPEDEDALSLCFSLSSVGLVVTTQNPVAVMAAAEASSRLSENGISPFLVINRLDLSDLASYKEGTRQRVSAIIDETNAKLLGIVPESYALCRRHEEGTLLLTEDITDLLFDNMAARWFSEDVPLFQGMKDAKKLRKKI